MAVIARLIRVASTRPGRSRCASRLGRVERHPSSRWLGKPRTNPGSLPKLLLPKASRMATAALARRRTRSSCSTPSLCNCANLPTLAPGEKNTGVVFSAPMMSGISHLDLVFHSPETAAAQVISLPARVQGGAYAASQMSLPHRIVNELSVKSWDPIDPNP